MSKYVRAACSLVPAVLYNSVSRLRYSTRPHRWLEIGPGQGRIEGFETLRVIPGWSVDYVADASKRMPFRSETFDLVYASHVLEHVPWYQVEATLKEWVRILKRGGRLEVWVPDGLKICKALVEAEEHGHDYTHLDGWYRLNPEKDPCMWAAGRLFTYGDGKGRLDHPNWHRAIFTPRYLRHLFEKAGFVDVRELTHEEVRGYDHGWINLGIIGVKP
jgi:predicted SAM-dependent methyltransferase